MAIQRIPGSEYQVVPEVSMGEVAEVIMGQSPPGATYNERGEGVPFFQGVADFGYRRPSPRVYCTAPTRMARPGDILLSVRAPIGRVNVADQICAIGRGLTIVRAKRSEDSRYLEFVLRLQEDTWRALESSGSVFGNATKVDLETLRLPWPPSPVRQSVARILGTLDDKIELNRRVARTLEEIARAIFKSWFVDFDPVRAKAEGRRPAVPPELEDLFPSRLVDSPIGPVPVGWQTAAIRQLVSLSRDTLDPQDFPDEPFDHYSFPAFDQGRQPHAEVGSAIKSRKFIVPPNALLLSKLNPRFPRIWIPEDASRRRAIASTEFLVLVASPGYSRAFVYGLVSSSPFQRRLGTLVRGTSGSHQRVRPDDFLSIPVPHPPQQLVRAYTQVVEPMLSLSSMFSRENRQLSSIRDWLLPKLISGRVRVRVSSGS